MSRTRIVSGTPFEPLYGYARAVRVGARIFVSGTTATLPGGGFHEGDAGEQTVQTLRNIERALREAGATLADVVRTRMFVVDIARNGDAVGRAHGEVFSQIRPTASLIGVVGLIDPRMLVEIEADAIVGEGG
jgi:enamine deaminase RidA (YjgF/YER057c/UK114 family)